MLSYCTYQQEPASRMLMHKDSLILVLIQQQQTTLKTVVIYEQFDTCSYITTGTSFKNADAQGQFDTCPDTTATNKLKYCSHI